MYKNLPLLAIVTLIFVIAASYSVYQRSPDTLVEKEPLYPQLADQIQNVSQVVLKDHKNTTVLVAEGDSWVLQNRGGFAAKFERIKPLVIALSELQIREAKTANSDLYSRLQVEDVSLEKAKSKQIILKDAKDQVLASLLIGKQRVNRTDGSSDSFYARKSDEQQSYLVKGSIDLNADPMEWLDNQLIDFSSDRVQSIRIKQTTGRDVEAIRSGKDVEDYQLQDLPEGFKLRSQATINSIAGALEELQFEDVQKAEQFQWPEDVATGEYTTFDGLSIKIKSALIEDQIWAAFSFGSKELKAETTADDPKKPTPAQQVESLNRETKTWVYALPEHKGKLLRRSLDELIIAVDPEQESKAEEKPKNQLEDQSETKPMLGINPSDLPPGITPEMLKGMVPPPGVAAPAQ